MSLSRLFDQMSDVANDHADEAFLRLLDDLPEELRAEIPNTAMNSFIFRMGFFCGMYEGPAFKHVLMKRIAEMQ